MKKPTQTRLPGNGKERDNLKKITGHLEEKNGKWYAAVNHYGADGRRSDSVQTLPGGDKYVTTYSYGDVYIYTP